MNDWIAIFETDQLYRAEMVKNLLCNNQIEAVILNHKDSSFKLGLISVMIKDEDKDKAIEIVNSVDCE